MMFERIGGIQKKQQNINLIRGFRAHVLIALEEVFVRFMQVSYGGLHFRMFSKSSAGDLVQPCAQMSWHKPYVDLLRAKDISS